MVILRRTKGAMCGVETIENKYSKEFKDINIES